MFKKESDLQTKDFERSVFSDFLLCLQSISFKSDNQIKRFGYLS